MRWCLGSAPDSAGEAYSAPLDFLAGLRGEGRRGEWKRREGNRGEGKGQGKIEAGERRVGNRYGVKEGREGEGKGNVKEKGGNEGERKGVAVGFSF